MQSNDSSLCISEDKYNPSSPPNTSRKSLTRKSPFLCNLCRSTSSLYKSNHSYALSCGHLLCEKCFTESSAYGSNCPVCPICNKQKVYIEQINLSQD